MGLRSPRTCLIILLLGIAALSVSGFSACSPGPYKAGSVDFSGIPTEVEPGQQLGIWVTYDFKANGNRPADKACIGAIGIVWQPGPSGRSREVLWTSKSQSFGPCPTRQRQKVFTKVPDWFAGGTVSIEVSTPRIPGGMATNYYYAGAVQDVAVKGAAAATPGAGQTPSPHIMQVQMPVAPVSTMANTFPGLVDARQSSDPQGGTLAYSWDLNGDGVYGDDTAAAYGLHGPYPVSAQLPEGMAWIAPGEAYNGQGSYPTVSVKVTSSASKLSATATTSVRVQDPGSGMISFGQSCGAAYENSPSVPGGVFDFCIWTPINNATGGFATVACVDANEDGVYNDAVANWSDVAYASNQVPLQSFPVGNRGGVNARITAPTTAGWHAVRALVWDPGHMTNGCATPLVEPVHQTPGVLSQLAYAYRVSTAGGRAGAGVYTAKTALRLAAGTALTNGTLTAQGTVTGLVLRGTFRLPTPAASKGVKRPDGLGSLTAGDYVLRTEGVSLSGGSDWLGPATMLLRGRDGTLGCFGVVGDPGSSALTLLGGSGAVAKLETKATGPALTMTGSAKPPTNIAKASKAKGKPASVRGSLTASVGSKSRALPATCASLRRYLP